MLPEITREELSTVLEIVAAEPLAPAGILQPPVNALRIAQILGLAVAWDDRQSGRARLVSLASAAHSAAPSIFLKHDPRQERIQWAVAHEIGEILTPRIFDQLGIDVRHAPPQAREQVANSFAARLLLPGDWFSTDGTSCGWDLIELKQRYETASHELIARRMLDLLVPVIISVYDHDRLTWRKSNLTGRQPPPCRREIECRLGAHATGETVVDDGPPQVHAWAVHEPDWRREIVRLEVDEFAWESRDD
jgi:Zn-dependent peptidase ImmA (M78 family)